MKLLKYLTVGIIMTGSLLFSTTAYAGSRQGRLTGDHVRVRQTPCLETDNILFQVSRGQAVEILDTAGDFYRVNVRDSHEVYIFREFVAEVDVTVTSDTPEPILRTGVLVDDLIAYAKSYIGVPYRFGSTDPSRGFDCSGFVTVVMRNFGVYLQRSSASMASTNGTYVSRYSLEPGDLVFFATGGGRRVSHVGIYIGGGEFIHSASNVGVTVNRMDQTYYRTRFVRANRVL